MSTATIKMMYVGDKHHVLVTPGQIVSFEIGFDPIEGRTLAVEAARGPGQNDHTRYVIEQNGQTGKGSGDLSKLTHQTFKRGDVFHVTLFDGTEQVVALVGESPVHAVVPGRPTATGA